MDIRRWLREVLVTFWAKIRRWLGEVLATFLGRKMGPEIKVPAQLGTAAILTYFGVSAPAAGAIAIFVGEAAEVACEKLVEAIHKGLEEMIAERSQVSAPARKADEHLQRGENDAVIDVIKDLIKVDPKPGRAYYL